VVNPETLDKPQGQWQTAGGRWMRSPLYDEVARIPLMLRMPGRPAGPDRRLVSAVDVAPTVLDLLGVAIPEYMQGRSLVRDDAPAASAVLTSLPLATPGDQLAVVDDAFRDIAEWQPITVRTQRWTMLFASWSTLVELYDNDADSGQTTNVAESHPEVVAQLHETLIEMLIRGNANPQEIEMRCVRPEAAA
jgi:arylsulfatase A-like enzyme